MRGLARGDGCGGGAVRRLAAIAVLSGLAVLAGPARADLIIPSGGVTSLANGALDLGCTDLIVGGTLHVDAAVVSNIRNVAIQPGGILDAGAGSLGVGGNWSNSGTFSAGTSVVAFGDACSTGTATISGSTSFYDVSFVTSTAKTWAFAVGSTQTIVHLLTIQGTAANPLQFISTAPGQVAFINLTGAQNIIHVGVTDVWATGEWLAPFLTNEGGGGNANRWFGVPFIPPIPASSPAGLLLLVLLLSAAFARAGSRRLRHEGNQGSPQ